MFVITEGDNVRLKIAKSMVSGKTEFTDPGVPRESKLCAQFDGLFPK